MTGLAAQLQKLVDQFQLAEGVEECA
jgi:hypothetical protein